MEKLTIRDIAKQSGVSVATVSRAINPHTSHFVKKSTRNKILRMVKRANYLPSPVAKRLATGKSTNIVIFLSTRYTSIFYSDYYTKLLSGAMSVLENTQYNLVVRMLKHTEYQFNLNKVVHGMDVAASIICDFLDMLQVSMSGLENMGMPVVILNRTERKQGVTFMALDNFKGGYDATNHLVQMGHRRIAIIKGTYYEKDMIDRFEGYKKALADNFIPFNDAYVFEGDFTEKTGIKATEYLMALKDRPTAVFCTNDEIAIGTFMQLDNMGIRCPKDVSLMGFDGLDMGRYLVPKLTSMALPIYEIAQEAAKALLGALEGKREMGELRIFEATLFKGGTCGRPPSRTAIGAGTGTTPHKRTSGGQ